MNIKGYLFLSVILGVALSLFSPVQAEQAPVDTQPGLVCVAGEVVLFDGSQWVCSDAVSQLNNMVLQLSQLVNDQQAIIDRQAAVLQYFSLEQLYDASTGKSYPTVRITAANLQVVNGVPETPTANGTGNIIAGYNSGEAQFYSCSDGQWSDELSCIRNGKIWSNAHRSGSHYIVVGAANNYSNHSGFLGGVQNTINREWSSILSGAGNIASGPYSSILGGVLNESGGWVSSIAGGELNTASGDRSSILGGQLNTAESFSDTIVGGKNNTASGRWSTVLGGVANTTSGQLSSVSGGAYNTASGAVSSVSGGNMNTASGPSSSVLGGNMNTASGASGSASTVTLDLR